MHDNSGSLDCSYESLVMENCFASIQTPHCIVITVANQLGCNAKGKSPKLVASISTNRAITFCLGQRTDNITNGNDYVFLTIDICIYYLLLLQKLHDRQVLGTAFPSIYIQGWKSCPVMFLKTQEKVATCLMFIHHLLFLYHVFLRFHASSISHIVHFLPAS